MRVVQQEKEFDEQAHRAMSEAQAAFGDGSVFIEKYISSPRHIEIQVLGDQHGNVVFLFERECSIQRRHQKLIEESPSPALTPELRQKMGETAVNACREIGYVSAGTMEFLLDPAANVETFASATRPDTAMLHWFFIGEKHRRAGNRVAAQQAYGQAASSPARGDEWLQALARKRVEALLGELDGKP